MDREELLAIFDREQRIEIQFPGVAVETAGHVIRHCMPGNEPAFIAYSNLEDRTADAAIDQQMAYFADLNLSFEWKVYDHDGPADLRQRLAARGFEIGPDEALLVLDMQNAPDFYWALPLPEITQIRDAAGIQDLIAMEEEVWQTNHADLGERLVRDLYDLPDLLSVFAIREDGCVVSGAWIYYHPPSQFASLWGGSTRAASRQRGYYTSLLVARAREARQRGFRFLTVDASPMSRPILEKHGFLFLGFSTPCVWNAPFNGKEPANNG